MRICAFGRSLPVHQLGGMELHFEMLTQGLAHKGHEVTIITTKHPDGLKYEKKKGVEIHYLPKTFTGRYEFGFWRQSVKKFEELMSIKKFDLIYSESIAAYGYVRKKKKGRFHLPVVIIAHGTFLGEFRTKIRGGIPSPNRILGILKNLHSYMLERRFYPDVEVIVGAGRAVAESLSMELSIKQKIIHILPNGIDIEKFRPDQNLGNKIRIRLGLTEDDELILAAGRLHREKGIQLTIFAMQEILSKISSAKLLVIGEGKYERKLKQLTQNLNLNKNVIFLSRVPNEDLVGYYNACDLFLMPTLRDEGLPLSLLEVMACKKPVVASMLGGIPFLLEDGVTGILIKPGDKSALVQQTVKLLQDRKLADSLAHRAWEKVINEYSLKKMVDAIEELFQKVIKQSIY